MKKFLAYLLASSLAISLFSSCGDEPQTTPSDKSTDSTSSTPPSSSTSAPSTAPATKSINMSKSDGDSWTVFVYLCGTDLETDGGFASRNIMEMVDALPSENVNIIIETGGTEQWQMEGISSTENQRWKVGEDGTVELVGSVPLANMGAAETLGDFLSWGVEAYSADKYFALLWDHGGGSISGIAVDELHEGDALDLKELSAAFDSTGTQFELIGFDACLMATMETAAALAPYGRYMVASQELEPGAGWNYTEWLSYMAENPTCTGLDVGTVIADGFLAKCAEEGTDSLVTLSVTDLSKLPALTAAFDTMAGEMKSITAIPEKIQPLSQAIVRAENYGGNNESEGYTNMVDLGDLTRLSEGVLPETSDDVLAALTAAIPYKVSGSGRQNSNGLSVYVPLQSGTEEMDAYATLAATSGDYLRFLEAITNWTVPGGVSVSAATAYPEDGTLAEEEDVSVDGIGQAEALNADDYKVEFTTYLDEDGSIVLDITSGAESINTVNFNLYYQDDESNLLWYLGSDFDMSSNDEGTQYMDNYRNVWTIINDNLCMMVALGFTDDYILYTVPVLVNEEETNLRMLYHHESGEYEVIGTWDGISDESGMSSREVKQLQDGDEVEFVFDAINLETGEDESYVSGGFTVSGAVVAEEATLFDGDYYYAYEITDIFGETYYGDYAILTVDGEDIFVEMME